MNRINFGHDISDALDSCVADKWIMVEWLANPWNIDICAQFKLVGPDLKVINKRKKSFSISLSLLCDYWGMLVRGWFLLYKAGCEIFVAIWESVDLY